MNIQLISKNHSLINKYIKTRQWIKDGNYLRILIKRSLQHKYDSSKCKRHHNDILAITLNNCSELDME